MKCSYCHFNCICQTYDCKKFVFDFKLFIMYLRNLWHFFIKIIAKNLKCIIYIINALRARYSAPIIIHLHGDPTTYYWVVQFKNGINIPYPIVSHAGTDFSPYENGKCQRGFLERTAIIIQQFLLRRHFGAMQFEGGSWHPVFKNLVVVEDE